MTRRRGRASRRDSNHADLVKEARTLGMSVLDVADLPSGALDLVVGFAGLDVRVEIKPLGPPSVQKLTPDEQETFDGWRGRTPVVWTCVTDVHWTRSVLMGERMAKVPTLPGERLVDYSTDTALHPFVPSADAVLCARCGEHENWHEGQT